MNRAEGHPGVAASFRDPSGFVFVREGLVHRQVNHCYQEDYLRLMGSGLYDKLVGDGLLIPHEEFGVAEAVTADAYQVIRPAQIPFISQPYEWCFSQLKHAALLTLRVQRVAADFGMSLKDASSYNVQFRGGKPVFIDTLSFEAYREGEPWVAYRQFCQHFLAPLALMSRVDVRLHKLLWGWLDGIPLDLASSLLPARSKASFSLLSHIHLHSRAQKRYAGSSVGSARGSMGRTAFVGLVDSLRSAVDKCTWTPGGTEWHDYYAFEGYGPQALEQKMRLVAEMVDTITPQPSLVWDLGANNGRFSRIASDRRILTVSMDQDHAAVEENYLDAVSGQESHVLPLVVDLMNPSPSLGWATTERQSLVERGPVGLVLALALMHHLAISGNVPLARIAGFLSEVCRNLIVEFVPKRDPQVQRLLVNREDIFEEYDIKAFERAFGERFEILRSMPILGTDRSLFLMRKRGN